MTRKQAETRLKNAASAFIAELLAVVYDDEQPKQARLRSVKVLDVDTTPEDRQDARRILARLK